MRLFFHSKGEMVLCFMHLTRRSIGELEGLDGFFHDWMGEESWNRRILGMLLDTEKKTPVSTSQHIPSGGLTLRSAGHCLLGRAHRNQSLPGPVPLLVCVVGWAGTVGERKHCKTQSGHHCVKYSAHGFELAGLDSDILICGCVYWGRWSALRAYVPKLMTFANFGVRLGHALPI